MFKSQVIQYLAHFSKSELSDFRDFVHSPYFNKHENTKALLDFILGLKDWNAGNLQKEKVFKVLFPNKKYQEQLLSNVLYYLLRLLRRFYMQKQIEKKELDQQLDLLEISLQKEQNKLFLQSSRKLQKTFQESTIQDSNYFFQQHRYEQLLDDYDLKHGKRISGDYLEKALSHFDAFFIGEKLRMTCQMLARKQVTGRDYSFSLLQELIVFLEKRKALFSKIPSVWVYFLIYKMMTQSDPKAYHQLKGQLKSQVTYFQHQEGRDLYTHALNYCIGRLNLGETEFRKESFELYQQMLENGLLYIDEILPHWDYTNIVALGLELQEYQWVSAFIKKAKDRLPKQEKENTFTYNLAAFYYSQKAYEEASTLLQKVEFTEMYYNLLTRILLLRIHFDSQNWDALEYTLETFRIFLLRTQKLEEQRRKSGLNLIRFTKSLQKLLEQKSLLSNKDYNKKASHLESQIRGHKTVLNRSWLLVKLQEMLGAKGS